MNAPDDKHDEGLRLLREWLKKADAHPETREFRGGYQPFLERATREYLEGVAMPSEAQTEHHSPLMVKLSAQSSTAPIAQGPCETTQTPRFQIKDCACGTYEGNLGPCLTWWEGGQVGRCVYCDHNLDCHVKLSKLLASPHSAKGEITDAMVNRFLTWPLPESVCSDLCATMRGAPHRSGTSLLSAEEARQMLEHVLVKS